MTTTSFHAAAATPPPLLNTPDVQTLPAAPGAALRAAAPAGGPAPLPPLPALRETERAALDDPVQLKLCTRFEPEAAGQPATAHTRLLIGGIHCAACAGTIEAALAGVSGVLRAEVSAASERAQVHWDPQRTRASELVEAIRRAGYAAFPDTGAEAVQRQARETRRTLWQLFVAAFCMMQVMMYATPAYVAEPGDLSPDMAQLLRWASWVLSIPVLVFSAGPFFSGAWRALRQRRISMDAPVALGLAVTFVASTAATFEPNGLFGSEVYFDSLTMFVTFLLAARLLESRARSRAARALDAVMRRLPDAVERLGEGDAAQWVGAAELRVGDRVRVQAGQAFAADGVVEAGRTAVDESLLTGESRPVARAEGDAVSAGCINLDAPVVMRVQQVGADTRYQRIVALVERALTERPALMRAADRIAAPFLWGVLLLAGGAALAWWFIDPTRAVWVAVSVLIVTCPCALSIGAPVALLAAAGRLARQGVLVQRLDALEALARVDTVVFDKTGTLTDDAPALAQVRRLDDAALAAAGMQGRPGDDALVALAGSLAVHSRHPLARALASAVPADAGALPAAWRDVQERAGSGLQAWLDPPASTSSGAATAWRLGSAAWCHAEGQIAAAERPGVYLAVADVPPGAAADDATAWRAVVRFEFDESLRTDAPAAVAELRAQGLHLHLWSGDQPAPVRAVAERLALVDVRAAATPADKLAAVHALQRDGHRVAMVGDGINDAPVLAQADVSIAMASAAALAQAHADVVTLGNRLTDVPMARTVARQALRVVRQNLAWAVSYNLACVPLALAGWLPPWLAGIGMAASSLLVVLNATRLTGPLQRGAPAAPRIAPVLR